MYIIRVAYLYHGEKTNANCLNQIKVRKDKMKTNVVEIKFGIEVLKFV